MNARPRSVRERVPGGFTLMEVLLALFVFVVAVLGLVECINTMGLAAAETRLEQRVQTRLDSLLLEATRRHAWSRQVDTAGEVETKTQEEGVTFRVKVAPVDLRTDDNAPLKGIYHVSVTARWSEDGRGQESSAETWVWPYLFGGGQ